MTENKMAMIEHMRMMGMPLTKELVDYLYETVKKQQKEIEEMQQINESTLKLLKKAKGFINDMKPWHEQASSNNADLQNMAENLLILAIHKLES